jgi:hypothetical protein
MTDPKVEVTVSPGESGEPPASPPPEPMIAAALEVGRATERAEQAAATATAAAVQAQTPPPSPDPSETRSLIRDELAKFREELLQEMETLEETESEEDGTEEPVAASAVEIDAPNEESANPQNTTTTEPNPQGEPKRKRSLLSKILHG